MSASTPLARIVPGSLSFLAPEPGDDVEVRLDVLGAVQLTPGWEYEAGRVQLSLWDAEGRVLACDTGSLDLEYLGDATRPLAFELRLHVRAALLQRATRLRLVPIVEAHATLGQAHFPYASIPTHRELDNGQVSLPRLALGAAPQGSAVLSLSRHADSTDMNIDLLARVSFERPFHRLRADLSLLDAGETPVFHDDSSQQAQGDAAPTVLRLRYFPKLPIAEQAATVLLLVRVEVREASEALDLELASRTIAH